MVDKTRVANRLLIVVCVLAIDCCSLTHSHFTAHDGQRRTMLPSGDEDVALSLSRPLEAVDVEAAVMPLEALALTAIGEEDRLMLCHDESKTHCQVCIMRLLLVSRTRGCIAVSSRLCISGSLSLHLCIFGSSSLCISQSLSPKYMSLHTSSSSSSLISCGGYCRRL